jgi:hypothetical protein
MTDGHSASLSCDKTPRFVLLSDSSGLLMWDSLSDKRTGLLLVLDSAVILGSESRGTRDHILLSQIRGSRNLEGQVPDFYLPGTGWPIYTPRHWVPFSSPPTTHRATVEVFDPASTREDL